MATVRFLHLWSNETQQGESPSPGILSHVLHTDGTLPDGSGGGGQELLVVRLAQQQNQRLQTFVHAHQVTSLFVLCTLQGKTKGQDLQ